MRTRGTTGRLIGAVAGVSALAAGALAGPPRFDQVDAKATWVLHIDFEEAVGTDLGAWLLHHLDEDLEEDEFAATLKGDLEWGRDIKGITLYGWEHDADEKEDESIVAVLRGSERLTALEERLWHGHKFLHGDKEFEVAGREVMSLGEPGDDEHVFVMPRSGERGERVFIASTSREWLSRAAHVMDGRRDGLGADSAILEAASPPERAMIVAIATDLPGLSGADPVSNIAREADAIWGSVSERDGHVHLRLAASSPNEEEAGAIADVLQGLVALGRLMAGEIEDEGLQDLVSLSRGLQFGVEGRMVRVSLEVDSDRVSRMLKEHGDWNDHDHDDDHDRHDH